MKVMIITVIMVIAVVLIPATELTADRVPYRHPIVFIDMVALQADRISYMSLEQQAEWLKKVLWYQTI